MILRIRIFVNTGPGKKVLYTLTTAFLSQWLTLALWIMLRDLITFLHLNFLRPLNNYWTKKNLWEFQVLLQAVAILPFIAHICYFEPKIF